MRTHSKKELTPIVYGETSVKTLFFSFDAKMPGFGQHWHDRMEFHLVKSGTLELTCNEERLLVEEGQVSIISPGFSHSGAPSGKGVEYSVLMFDVKDLYNGTVASGQYLDPIINGKICFKPLTDLPQIVELVAEIIEMNNDRTRNHSLEVVGSLYRLLGLLHRYCIDDKNILKPATERFDSIINYINANFTKEISVGEISKKFNYEKSYFCRKFKNIVGVTATRYIRLQRLEYARKLLENTNKSIMNIAFSSGFADSAYFINCFKKAYGETPLKYRATHKKREET